ncbi:GNAT family N-acetyltransferase [Thalassotalea sp. G2M2-11]|uniref:GNAT family N-acetyltransferase n=1 Tax=Thalassotalea sp. G2M2-11 TaxID=2787627 RepID=UPI0019D17436|nr:GNAT family N-acetyltransferase [Thalassotalea sp. G2M2-11]
MEVKLFNHNTDRQAVLDLFLQLRANYDNASLLTQIEKQQKHGYQVVYVKSSNEVLAVAGFSVGEKLAWGKHIYIEDLITDENSRSQGIGKLLIDWFKNYAKDNHCEQIHLDSGVQRFAAHRFYLREGFNIASHHFSIINVN